MHRTAFVGGAPSRRTGLGGAQLLKASRRGRPSHKAAACTALLLWEARPRGESGVKFGTVLKTSRRGRPSHRLRLAPHRFCGRRAPAANGAQPGTVLKTSRRGRPSHRTAACTAPLLWEARPRSELGVEVWHGLKSFAPGAALPQGSGMHRTASVGGAPPRRIGVEVWHGLKNFAPRSALPQGSGLHRTAFVGGAPSRRTGLSAPLGSPHQSMPAGRSVCAGAG